MFDIFKSLNKKIKKIPFAYEIPKFNVIDLTKLKIPKNKFIFLFIFDLNSYYHRKNPDGLIECFLKCFKNDNKTILILKVNNSRSNQTTFNKLLEKVKNHSNVILIHKFLNNDEYYSLIKHSNCYVSLHRSEGFGLTMFEAMSLNVPVIATGYSGNLEFMNHKNSMLVRYKLKHSQDNYLYNTESVWAEPDLIHAAKLLKLIRNDKYKRNEIKRAAKKHIKDFNNTHQKKFLNQFFNQNEKN